MSVFLQFLLPLLTSIYVYSKIVRTLHHRSLLRLKNTKNQAKREEEMSRNKRRTFLLLSMIAGIGEENIIDETNFEYRFHNKLASYKPVQYSWGYWLPSPLLAILLLCILLLSLLCHGQYCVQSSLVWSQYWVSIFSEGNLALGRTSFMLSSVANFNKDN